MTRLISSNDPAALPPEADRRAKAIAYAERLAWHANVSLRLAKRSRNVASRTARLIIVRDNIRRLKELTDANPFIHMTAGPEFEESIRKVDSETIALSEGTDIKSEVENPTTRSLVLRIQKVGELIGNKIALYKGNGELAKMLVNVDIDYIDAPM